MFMIVIVEAIRDSIDQGKREKVKITQTNDSNKKGVEMRDRVPEGFLRR